MKTINVKNKMFLSEVFDRLPSKCLLNKGLTGCGGTYCELNSKRNSIILVPTIELVKNKLKNEFFGLYGKITNTALSDYCNSNIQYKKIIATYDSLPRIMQVIPKYYEYFLLIDEYHVLFNQYGFRNSAITFILNNYKSFNDYCFMSATPLEEDAILEEIKQLNRITINWKNAVSVNLDIHNVYFTIKELLKIINEDTACNYHIFLNSVKTIRELLPYINKDYKIVCSPLARRGYANLNYGSTLDKPKKYNFYTACSFEGTDIYDSIGKTIILCDTNIATTILDISTIVRQICGRLRDSIYKNQITMILNASKHRYASKTLQQFKDEVIQNVQDGKTVEQQFINATDKRLELRKYSPEAYNSFYVNRFADKLYYDDNLRKIDEYNYKLVNEIYQNSLSVVNNINLNEMQGKIVKNITAPIWILDNLYKREYTYEELVELFTPIFIEHGLSWNKQKSISLYFPEHTKMRRTINGKKQTIFRFNI